MNKLFGMVSASALMAFGVNAAELEVTLVDIGW